MGDSKQFPGLGFDPTPGIVPAVEGLLSQVRTSTGEFAALQGDLDRIGLDNEAWRGPAGQEFHGRVNELIPNVGFIKESLLSVQMALSSWSALLSEYQRSRTSLEEQAVAARARIAQAKSAPGMDMAPHGFEDKEEYDRKTALYTAAKAEFDAAETHLAEIVKAAKGLEQQHKTSAESAAGDIDKAAEVVALLRSKPLDPSLAPKAPNMGKDIDDLTGRAPGETREGEDAGRITRQDGSSVSSDWAGRKLLEHYLWGGGDTMTIENDPDWTEYMNANPELNLVLTGQERPVNPQYTGYAVPGGNLGVQPPWYPEIALAAVQSQSTFGNFDMTHPLELRNGEGMVGYEYLHGTNKDVGGFNAKGHTVVTRMDDGTYVVKVTADLTFNDVVDPNLKYSTDKWKAGVANVISLGQAESYNLRVTWPQEAVVRIAADGKTVLDVQNTPAK
ncbi:hypothetical protein [Yinghuangia sp. YIM S09857]|uniref:hypothetical protein n=1 Tax=Yinghuangia sp. YIM S09857 TaxID=3436929 RepID=UPI003F533C5C